MISHFLESHFKSSCILFMLWLSLNLFCYLGTAGIWEWVEADPLSECPGLNLLSLQPEDGPDCLLQVLAGEAGSCTSVEQGYGNADICKCVLIPSKYRMKESGNYSKCIHVWPLCMESLTLT